MYIYIYTYITFFAITPSESRTRSNGNEGVFRIPQSCRITGATVSDCLTSYQDTLWGVLSLWRDAVGVFYSPSRLGMILFRV